MPLIDLANPLQSEALSQLAGPFGSYLGGGTFPQSYEYAKRFVANSRSAYGSGNNGVTSLDDPTYLGFSLMFDITSPLFNGATNGDSGIIPPILNPAATAAGDLAVSLLNGANQDQGSSDKEFPSTPSAIAYLNKIGEANRAQYLKAFIQGIQEINQTRPYYFQTITGLLEAWQKSMQFNIDPYTGTTGEEGITIGCLEAIDLKLTALFSLYKMAVYDSRYKRFVLPKNLREFNVYVYVQEIRKFKTVRNWLQAINPSNALPDTKKFTNENTSQIGFKFMECEFDAGASGNVFEGVTNNGGEIATTQMKFKYSLMENISQFSGFDSKLDEGKAQGNTDPTFKDKLKQFGKDQLNNLADGAINLVGRTVSSAIQGVTLGNVFGVRNELLGTISNPQGLINAAIGAAVQSGDPPAETQGGKDSFQSGTSNSLGEANPPNQTLSGTDSAFDASTNTLGGLNVTNAFGPSGPPNNSTITDENIFS